MDYEVRWLDLKSIDQRDATFRLTTREDTRDLETGIGASGLINAPLVEEKEKGLFRIVSGFRRVRAITNLKQENIPVRILSKDLPFSKLAFLAVTENASQRPLNVLEQARAVRLIAGSGPVRDSFRTIEAALGQKTGPAYLEKLVPLLELPKSLFQAVVDEKIPFASALALARLDPEEALFLGRLFMDLPLGLNKQREVMNMALEIAKRDDIPLQKVLVKAAGAIEPGNPEKDKGEVARNLRKRLYHMRYPKMSGAMDAFDKQVKSLGLKPWMRFVPPAGLEGNLFEIRIAVKDQKDLEKAKHEMDRLSREPAWEKIFKKY